MNAATRDVELPDPEDGEGQWMQCGAMGSCGQHDAKCVGETERGCEAWLVEGLSVILGTQKDRHVINQENVAPTCATTMRGKIEQGGCGGYGG